MSCAGACAFHSVSRSSRICYGGHSSQLVHKPPRHVSQVIEQLTHEPLPACSDVTSSTNHILSDDQALAYLDCGWCPVAPEANKMVRLQDFFLSFSHSLRRPLQPTHSIHTSDLWRLINLSLLYLSINLSKWDTSQVCSYHSFSLFWLAKKAGRLMVTSLFQILPLGINNESDDHETTAMRYKIAQRCVSRFLRSIASCWWSMRSRGV